jgi:hypothetical protein
VCPVNKINNHEGTESTLTTIAPQNCKQLVLVAGKITHHDELISSCTIMYSIHNIMMEMINEKLIKFNVI